jgi:hypothetical protein
MIFFIQVSSSWTAPRKDICDKILLSLDWQASITLKGIFAEAMKKTSLKPRFYQAPFANLLFRDLK